MYKETTATKRVKALNKRIRGLQGGTSASKTVSAVLYLIAKAQSDTTPTLTSIVSESFPHLRRGAMKDFLDIMKTHHYYKEDNWSRTDFTYTFETGSKIEFFSVDQSSKVRGPRRDRLMINEANNVPYETYEQLEIRTREFIILDWNPVSPFWFHDELLDKRDDVEMIILTYKDNEALDKSIVESIEKRKINKNWWTVYGLGQLGEIEGRIFTGWQIIDDIPFNARLERRGLDFGYSVDPSAVVAVYKYDGGYILDEELYQKGMSNQAIAEFIKNLKDPQTIVVADSAEPKSIDEIKLYGVPIIPATKGQGSISQGIQYVQNQRISVTKRSTDLIKEYRGYLWKTDNDGRSLNVPESGNDHALDAIRYAVQSLNVNTSVKPHKPARMLQRKYAR